MQAPARSLVMPAADFWLLGGLSIVVLAALWAAESAHMAPLQQGLPSWVYYAGFAINYPHFAYSYQLFYAEFRKGLVGTESRLQKFRLIAAGIVAPVLMVAYFGVAYATRSLAMLSDAAIAMLFLVGWHYAKQGYGVLIASSVYRGIFYTAMQKRILYANAYIVWIYSWMIVHQEPGRATQFDLVYVIPVVPGLIMLAATAAVLVAGLLTAGVFIKTVVQEKKGIAWSGVTGYACAIYLWLLLPQMLGSEAVFMAVPFFHGLQYLPFVYKYKKTEYGADREADFWRDPRTLLAVFALLGMALGDFFMDIGPRLADRVYDPGPPGFTRNFFLIAFTVFINIHHYFIDHSFWRRENTGARKFLFEA